MSENKKADIGALMKQKGKLMLVTNSPISSKQVLQIFQKTPPQHIKTRPAKGGGTWDYVTGVYIKKVLNFVFGWLWSFQIIDKGVQGDQVWVQGRLTINNPKNPTEAMIVKEQFGRADIKFKKDSKIMLDYGNDLKAAASDALKKCAAELGIASDVYGKAEFKEIGIDFDKKDPTPGSEATYECHGCAEPINKQIYDFSKKVFKKPLCRKCQSENSK